MAFLYCNKLAKKIWGESFFYNQLFLKGLIRINPHFRFFMNF